MKSPINYNVPLNNKVQNKNIKANVLSDEDMRKAGFTDKNPNNWYYCRILNEDEVKCMIPVSFNVTISKKTSKIKIDILDENWLQPYNYQSILERDPSNKFANEIHKKVQAQMKLLMEKGIITGYNENDFI